MTSLTSMKFKCVGIISNSQKQFIAILEHWIYWSLDQILPNVSSVSWHCRLSKISFEYVTWLLFLVSWMGSWPVLINIKWNNNLVDISSFRRIWQKLFDQNGRNFGPVGFCWRPFLSEDRDLWRNLVQAAVQLREVHPGSLRRSHPCRPRQHWNTHSSGSMLGVYSNLGPNCHICSLF